MSATIDAPPKAPTLREIIRKELEQSSSPDPSAIVDGLLPNLSDAHFEEAARLGLRTLAGEEVRHYRRRATTEPEPVSKADRRAAAQASSNGGTTSKKWARIAKTVAARPDIFAMRVVVGHEDGQPVYRFLGDCTKDDLTFAARLLRDQGDALHARAAQYDTLAGRLRSKSAIVRTLPLATIESVLS